MFLTQAWYLAVPLPAAAAQRKCAGHVRGDLQCASSLDASADVRLLATDLLLTQATGVVRDDSDERPPAVLPSKTGRVRAPAVAFGAAG